MTCIKEPFAALPHSARKQQVEGLAMRCIWMAVVLAGLGGAALAEGEISVGDAVTGEALYQEHCAVCHGAEATGDGPMAPVLLVQPSDLTTLVSRHQGAFPLERVVMRIDGRDPLVSHGSQMPVYGLFFQGQDVALRTDAGQPILTSQPIADIVAWLRTIQQ